MMPHLTCGENIPQRPWRRIQVLESQIRKTLSGYARLGYGNYGNLDARANYLFILPNSDKLNLNFHMNGMDGKLDLPDSKDKWDARYYRTHAGMDYVHAFGMDLNVAGNSAKLKLLSPKFPATFKSIFRKACT